MSEPETQSPKSEEKAKEPLVPEVTFDEFKRIDIRVAKVVEATRVPNSARLVKLSLDIGGIKKQCIAGIGARYEPRSAERQTYCGSDESEASPDYGADV